MNKQEKDVKQEILVEILDAKLQNAKVGVIVRGITNVDPVAAIQTLADSRKTKYYVSVVGYNSSEFSETDSLAASNLIEDAVKWRSDPSLAGRIIAFVESDSDKLHSLAEFDEVTTRDLSLRLIDKQISASKNDPCRKFWEALRETSSYYSFDILCEFIEACKTSNESNDAIPVNMWRLGLLKDSCILNTNIKPGKRLSGNREFITKIGQLSNETRKKICAALTRSNEENDTELQNAYKYLQDYFKYGKQESLEHLSYDVVERLLGKSRRKKDSRGKDGESKSSTAPLKTQEVDKIIADVVVSPTEDKLETLREFYDELEKKYDEGNVENKEDFPTIGGVFENRPIELEKPNAQFRKIIGAACSYEVWGGIMDTEEGVLCDAMASDYNSFSPFCPMEFNEADEITRRFENSSSKKSLFEYLSACDNLLKQDELENVQPFTPVLEKLKTAREALAGKLDLIMYHPILSFGVNEELGQALDDYMTAWTNLLHIYCQNETKIRDKSSSGSSIIASALLQLDVLYVKTPTEWKGLLLPMHPLFLWRYYEIFKELKNHRASISEEDAKALTETMTGLPHMLNFIVVGKSITGDNYLVLPCSGSIKMLPVYENKTNRFLGCDQAIAEILSRWAAFAPYTRNEVRICTVDAQDMPGILKSFKESIEKGVCSRIVYDVYLTRSQNGNRELAKLDYMSDDYEVGEYVKSGRISIRIQNCESSTEIKKALKTRPVHLAFYFDQSSYSIEYGSTAKSKHITPLVVTYDYKFDELTQRGEIFPSSDTDSGMIGDYHKILRLANSISNAPCSTYNLGTDVSAIVSTICDNDTQWLIVADRTTSHYCPGASIPIGEKQYGKRMVSIWGSCESRIIDQYLSLLKQYNLYPEKQTLVDVLSRFGHISSEGLVSIPRIGADPQAIDNRRKGLIGAVFVAAWYSKLRKNSLVASLDTSEARLWLNDSRYPNDRADLIGLYYDKETQTLYIQPIEVKTRDEPLDVSITVDEKTGEKRIEGHAVEQVAAVVRRLKEIFGLVEAETLNMFVLARREVLKYQIVSECFRGIHDPESKREWSEIFKDAFVPPSKQRVKIEISGLLVHVKLSEAVAKKPVHCINSTFDDCPVCFWELTSKEIQEQILGRCRGAIPAGTSIDYDDVVCNTTDEVEQEKDMIDNSDDSMDVEQTRGDEGFDDAFSTPAPTTGEREIIESDADSNEALACKSDVSLEKIEQLISDFKKSCGNYKIKLKECCAADEAVVGPNVIRIYFKLADGQRLETLDKRSEDVSREMKRSGIMIQTIQNSDKLILDIPRLHREKVFFSDVIEKLPPVDSPEKLFFPLGRTPEGKDIIEDLSTLPHLLVGGSTGSGKTVFLQTMLAALLKTHPTSEEMQIVLASSGNEDFTHFKGIPHLVDGKVISSNIKDATEMIKDVVFKEFERREKILTEAQAANISLYNQGSSSKLAPMVVIIDEFADLADQLETKKDKTAFFNPVERIAQIGRKRGVHLVLCTQRPSADLVPSRIKAQISGRLALHVNDGSSSQMILGESGAQFLQVYGDMIYKNGAKKERAQGYFISPSELEGFIKEIKQRNE